MLILNDHLCSKKPTQMEYTLQEGRAVSLFRWVGEDFFLEEIEPTSGTDTLHVEKLPDGQVKLYLLDPNDFIIREWIPSPKELAETIIKYGDIYLLHELFPNGKLPIKNGIIFAFPEAIAWHSP